MKPKHLFNSSQDRGFTLVEMLLVLVILSTLAAIVYPNMGSHPREARVTAAQLQIKNFGTALSAFEIDNDRFPKGRDGLLELVQRPSDARNWRAPYLESIPKDPWGNEYIYTCPGKHNVATYDIASMGPDGVLGTEDDITNWQPGK
jgi:general secretion pathway protein G